MTGAGILKLAMQAHTRISLEDWQSQMQQGTLGAALACPDPYANANPYLLGFREGVRDRLADDGSKIIERITFWNELPVVGAVVASRLADRLDKISDRIEELA